MSNLNLKNSKVSTSFNSGFTLVEAMFAVFILTFSITVLMTVVANSLFQSKYAKNEITATYLAQEVIDSIRNRRDTIVLGSGDFSDVVEHYASCDSGDGCYIDVLSNSVNVCPYGGCQNLYYTENSIPFYSYSGSILSNFNRKINVSMNGGDEMKIKVTVSWKNGTSNKSLELESSLLNW